jgi:uncharacterized CHY-type Zn-finger protein
MAESSNAVVVHGVDVDRETRCAHWHSPLDIITIKFKCCGEWYACSECHTGLTGHDPARWQGDEFEERAILCGHCRSRLSIREYLNSHSTCPRCTASFNPACAKHYDLYFEM